MSPEPEKRSDEAVDEIAEKLHAEMCQRDCPRGPSDWHRALARDFAAPLLTALAASRADTERISAAWEIALSMKPARTWSR